MIIQNNYPNIAGTTVYMVYSRISEYSSIKTLCDIFSTDSKAKQYIAEEKEDNAVNIREKGYLELVYSIEPYVVR